MMTKHQVDSTKAIVRQDRAVLVLRLPAGFAALPLDEQRRLLEAEAVKALHDATQQVERRALAVAGESEWDAA